MSLLLSAEAPPRSLYRWRVDTLTRVGGVAEVARNNGSIRIMVADRPRARPAAALQAGCEDTTEAWLHGDGRVRVRSHIAPPALLVSESGARLLPAAPECEATVVASDGDILVLCSAEALDHLPSGLGGVLAWSPLRLGAQHPADLLEKLMTGSDVGAALIARCTAVPTRS